MLKGTCYSHRKITKKKTGSLLLATKRSSQNNKNEGPGVKRGENIMYMFSWGSGSRNEKHPERRANPSFGW